MESLRRDYSSHRQYRAGSASSAEPPGYWLATAGEEPFSPAATLPALTDVVVIGGGLMGVATTYWLSRLGLGVLLVESRRLAWGATGRNAGIFLPGLHPLEGADLVLAVLREERIDAGYERTGHLALASSPAAWDQIRAEIARRPPSAPPLHALDRPACEDLLGMRIATEFRGGRWCPDGHVIHPARLVHGLAVAALCHGAVVATQAHVTDVSSTSSNAWRVDTRRGPVRTRHVVFACNHALTRFHPALQRVMKAVHGQVLATAPLPVRFRPGMAVDFGTVYWRQTGDGTIVLGGRSSDGQADGGRGWVDVAVRRRLEDFLPRAFPDSPPVAVTRRWTGIMDCTADGRPIVGAVPHLDGQWVIGGFGGHGLPGGIGAGRALAQEVAGGPRSPLLDPFAPDRLGLDNSDTREQP
jgi:gamma-glutamylputrescine oxidase